MPSLDSPSVSEPPSPPVPSPPPPIPTPPPPPPAPAPLPPGPSAPGSGLGVLGWGDPWFGLSRSSYLWGRLPWEQPVNLELPSRVEVSSRRRELGEVDKGLEPARAGVVAAAATAAAAVVSSAAPPAPVPAVVVVVSVFNVIIIIADVRVDVGRPFEGRCGWGWGRCWLLL